MAEGTPPPVGSIGVTATGGVLGWGIRLLTFSRYNHAYIVGPAGLLVEAQPGGARLGHISMYPKAKYNSRTVIPDETREKIWQTALGFAQANNGKGIGYGWRTPATVSTSSTTGACRSRSTRATSQTSSDHPTLTRGAPDSDSEDLA
jgi:hypothetical protein